MTLEILSIDGQVVRKYSSKDKPEVLDSTSMQYPTYWFRPAQKVAVEAGHHRFIWDLRLAPPKGSARQHSISAVKGNTPSRPQGPFVMPGSYKVRLTVDGQSVEQPLEIKMDPRVTISAADLKAQYDYSMICHNAYHELQAMRESIEAQLNGKKKLKKAQYTSLRDMVGEGAPENPDIMYGSITERPNETIVGLQEKFLHMQLIFQNADVKPTKQGIEGVKRLQEIKAEMEKDISGRTTLIKTLFDSCCGIICCDFCEVFCYKFLPSWVCIALSFSHIFSSHMTPWCAIEWIEIERGPIMRRVRPEGFKIWEDR